MGKYLPKHNGTEAQRRDVAAVTHSAVKINLLFPFRLRETNVKMVVMPRRMFRQSVSDHIAVIEQNGGGGKLRSDEQHKFSCQNVVIINRADVRRAFDPVVLERTKVHVAPVSVRGVRRERAAAFEADVADVDGNVSMDVSPSFG